MLDKLQSLEDRYNKLNELLSDPEVISDSNKLREYSKEQSDLEPAVTAYRKYKTSVEELDDAKEMLASESDSDMLDMIKAEISELTSDIEASEEELKVLLLPKDPNDDKNVIVEIRAAAGGDEAALFAGDLYRMYARFAEANRWKTEVIEANSTGVGGYKEIIFMIHGKGAYSKLKFENGAHRVQRVPETEAQGRVHTSTATVAVLPEAEDVDVEVRNEDVKVDTYRASGAGGQHVNMTDSAVRLTHLPTGIVVSCQDEKSQIKNREKAFKVLRARLYDKYQQEAEAEYAESRKSAVGTGDRSERIRTYNYPQNRVTDHRIGLTIKKLDQIVEGKIDEIIDALLIEDQTSRLQEVSE
ncbi:peptide chain release factor 1 [Pseudogracilibacillus sp. SO10305]|uniref:peptide chain release factor 1 n=1 Tax=Pseudogracilibacillus sp. SO10305 TaxID=3098292 RepID=UPI00300E31D8